MTCPESSAGFVRWLEAPSVATSTLAVDWYCYQASVGLIFSNSNNESNGVKANCHACYIYPLLVPDAPCASAHKEEYYFWGKKAVLQRPFIHLFTA
jgi:hypothetical protein